MPLTVILIIISFPSPTLSFIPDLKPSFSANPSHCSLSFSSPGLTFTVTSEHIRFFLFSFSVLHFSVVVSARQTKPTRVGFRAHVKTASRNLARYGQRSFNVSGPSLWNSLPLTVRDSSLTRTQFCTRLKTFLFTRAYWTSP